MKQSIKTLDTLMQESDCVNGPKISDLNDDLQFLT